MTRPLWQAQHVISIHPSVADALADGRPVVALESTIIAHGLPYPDNLELARELELAVTRAGAVPATIAVLEGRALVGLDDSQLERLADPKRPVAKAGAADLAAVLALGQSAATTVSGTATLAARAGIRLFATGGIGGVHRGDASDVSADLYALATLPIAVVSAGPKAILDLHRTREALESLSVLVLGFGCDELPAFYCRESGIALEHRMDDPAAVARALHARFDLFEQGGALIANPVPKEHAIATADVSQWIRVAHEEAEAAGVSGKALTPFLLKSIAEQSGGEAVATNRALALNNARVAAAVAVCLSRVNS